MTLGREPLRHADQSVRLENVPSAEERRSALGGRRGDRSWRYTASGLNAGPVAAEFLQHANEEQMHADQIALPTTQLQGEPNFDPEGLATRSHAEYDASLNLLDMVKEDLIAERVAIQSYSEIITWLGSNDPTTRRMLEDILAMEEEYADDLLSILQTISA